MKYRLITQKKIEKELEIKSIQIDTEDGQIQILPGHEDIVSLLVPGLATVAPKVGETFEDIINGGILTVSEDLVTVVTDEVALDSDLVEEKIQEALEKARDKKLPEGTFDSEEARTRALAFMTAKLKASKKKRG